jgi:hypothetical protein
MKSNICYQDSLINQMEDEINVKFKFSCLSKTKKYSYIFFNFQILEFNEC